MNLILNTIRQFLVKQSAWMHFTLILIMSYLMVQLSHFVVPKIFYLWVFGLTIFSVPALIFNVFRDNVDVKKDKKYWVAWSIIFLIYPIILVLSKVDVITFPFAYQLANFDIDGSYTFASLSILFLILEVILLTINRTPKKNDPLPIIQNLNVFKIAIFIVATFCLFALLASKYFHLVTEGDSVFLMITKFIFYFIQLFIIYLSYYLYYYIHHNILYKNVLKEKGLIPYFLGLGFTVMLIVPLHNSLIPLFPVVEDLKLHPTALVDLFNDFNFGLPIFVLIISFPLIVIIEWYKQSNKVAILEQQKSKTELNLLKQQINPHFFFNTLNNLYSMSLNEDKETPETILQLSEMMRYVIYKGKEEKVKLREEVKYIEDYIKLQMIRVHQTVDLKINFDLDNDALEISPLMFIIILENAFKHGIEPTGQSSTLHLDLRERNGSIVFECYNSKPKDVIVEPNHGIGLDNLKKRLQIVYPNMHKLTIEDKNDSYKAILKINL